MIISLKGVDGINRLIRKYKTLSPQVRASIWFLVCSFMQRGVSMITTPIFTRLMSTEEYGQFNVFNSWFGILAIIVSMSLYQGVYTQGLIKYDEDRPVFSSSLQGLTLTLVLAWTVIYLSFHTFLNRLFTLTTVQMLSMLVMIWTGAVFGFWSSEQRVLYSYKKLLIITIILSIARPAVGAIMVLLSDDKVTARILSIVVVELVLFTGLFVSQMRKGKKFYSPQYWKYAVMFNLPLIPHYLSQIVLNSADRIMIGRMIGNSEAGIYSLAYSVASIISIFVTALSQTISPWFYQKIKENKPKEVVSVAYPTIIIIAVISLGLILLAPEVVAIFAPKSYYEAIYVMPPVTMGIFFLYCYDMFAKFAFYYEKTVFIMIASVAGAVLNIILNYIFIKMFGYIAAGYTTLFCFIVYASGHYIFMRKVCKECCNNMQPYEGKRLLMIIIPFLGAGFALLSTYNYPIVRYGIVGIVLIVGIILRKKIIDLLKYIMNLRKAER